VERVADNQGVAPESVPVCVEKAGDSGESGALRARASGFEAHLSLPGRENQGVTHCVTRTSFDRAAERFILVHRVPLRVAGLPDENSTVTATWSASLKA